MYWLRATMLSARYQDSAVPYFIPGGASLDEHPLVAENQKGPFLKFKRDHSPYQWMERGQHLRLNDETDK